MITQPSPDTAWKSTACQSALCFELTQTGVVLGRFEVPHGKCTIGSSPSCQIRLPGPHARPLQCLVVRSGDELTVTRWAPGISLNANDFTSEPLKAGDVLTIGDLLLKLNCTDAPADGDSESPMALIDEVSAHVAAEVLASDGLEQPESAPVEQLPDPSALHTKAELVRVQDANRHARKRFRKLAGAMRQLRREAGELNEQIDVLAEKLLTSHAVREQLASELHQTQAIAEERESQFGEELDRAIAELSASYERINTAEASLATVQLAKDEIEQQLTALASECEQLRADHAALTNDKQQLEQEIEARETIIGGLRSEVIELRQTLESAIIEMQQQNDALRDELNATIADRERQLADLRQDMEASVFELHEQNESLRQEVTHVTAEKDSEIASVTADLQSQLSALRQQNESLRQEVENATGECNRQNASRNALDSAVNELRTENESLHQQLADTISDRDRHIAELQRDLQQGPVELEAELAAVRSERQQLAQEKHRLTDELQDASKRIQLLEIDVCSAKSEYEQVHHQVSRLQLELSTAVAHASDLEARLADAECAAEVDRNAEVGQLTDELQTVLAQLAESASAVASAQLERDNLASQLAAAQLELAELVGQLHRITEELQAIKASAADNDHQRSRLAAELVDRDTRISALTQELQTIQEQSAADLASRNEQLEALSDELQSARDQIANASVASEQHFAQIVSDLQHAEARLQSDLREKESQIAQLNTELTVLHEQLAREVAEKETAIAELTQRFQGANGQVEAEFACRDEHIRQLSDELHLAREKAAAELQNREERLSELARELRDTQDQLEESVLQSDRLNELYQQAQADLAALSVSTTADTICTVGHAYSPMADTSEPPRDEDTLATHALLDTSDAPLTAADQVSEEYQPTSFIDRYSHMFDNGDSGPCDPEPADAAIVQKKPQELKEIAGDDSDALEAYMANMMKRVRGEGSSDDITPPVSRQVADEPGASFTNPVARMDTLTRRVSAPTDAEPEQEEKLIDLKELKETSQKPPLPTNLTAMRELANISARQAIAKHRKRRHFERALSKLLISGIAGSTSAYMLLTADDLLSPYFLGGCGVGLVSAYWGVNLLGIVLEMVRDGINDEPTPVEMTDDEIPLPIVPGQE